MQVVENDIERGSFVYLDFEHSWITRMKNNFVLEIDQLENELQ